MDHWLISILCGFFGGLLSGSILAYINPYASWVVHKKIEAYSQWRKFIESIEVDLELANQHPGFHERFIQLGKVKDRIHKYCNKKELAELETIEQCIYEITERNAKSSWEIGDFRADNKISQQYYNFLQRVVLRIQNTSLRHWWNSTQKIPNK